MHGIRSRAVGFGSHHYKYTISAFAKPQALAESAHRQGMDLAERAVPIECAAAAVGLYVESCLPYLMSNRYGHVNWTNAFIQWASVYPRSLYSPVTRSITP